MAVTGELWQRPEIEREVILGGAGGGSERLTPARQALAQWWMVPLTKVDRSRESQSKVKAKRSRWKGGELMGAQAGEGSGI